MNEETKPSDVLQAISDVLLGAPEMWTQGYFARTYPNGCGTSNWDSPHACQWCMVGLVFVAERDLGARLEWIYIEKIIGIGDVSRWNDVGSRTAYQVSRAFHRAADLARSEGK